MRALGTFCASLLLAGCAIHPLPEDVAGVGTADIVKQIRCESREALVGVIMEKLDDWARAGSDEAARLLEDYRQHPDKIADFGPGSFPGPYYAQLRSLINVFADTAIAYDFDLTMQEKNDLVAGTGLMKSLVSPKFTMGLGAGLIRSRSNRRVFTTSDRFSYLVSQLNRPNKSGRRYCDGKIVAENQVYPIAGRIGVDKSIRDFMEVSVFGNLAGSKAPTMTDNLAFATSINVSALPKVEFTPVTNAFQATNVSLTANADRTDTHKVSVALAIGDEGMKELVKFRKYVFSADRGGGAIAPAQRSYRGDRLSGSGTGAEIKALEAIDQVKRGQYQLTPAQ